MTDGAALLANILAHPEDDAPRLVYADWLDEHGEAERAEFIRLQIEDDRGQDARGVWTAGDRDRLLALARRVQELWRAGYVRWFEGRRAVIWWPGLSPDHPDGRVRRGFPRRWAGPTVAWLRHGPRLVRTYPLTLVELTDRRPSWVGSLWCWTRAVTGRGDDSIPPELFAAFPREATEAGGHRFALYRTPDAALAALSAACLAWARAEEPGR